MRKLCTDEVGGVRMEKNEKKKQLLQFKKTYFLYSSYLAALFGFVFQN